MSTMKNYLSSFLSRLALLSGLAAPFILLSPALVRADAITTFAVSGSAQNTSGVKLDSCAARATCGFSGMFKVDTTTGTLVSGSFDVTFPGLPTFDSVFTSGSIGNGWLFEASAPTTSAVLDFPIKTAPTPGSLVGFTGGSIPPMGSVVAPGSSFVDFYEFRGVGSITPVPEPSSLVLFASGMLVLGLKRRFGKKAGHPLSA